MSSASDAFESAVLCSFGGGVCSAAQRASAHAYLDAARAAPGAWLEAARRYEASPHAEVRFWCLQTLVALASAPDAPIGVAERAALRPAVTAWLLARPPVPIPPFLRAKAAQLFAALLAADAAAWQAPLAPLLDAASRGDTVPLAAALRAVHDDVVALLDFDCSPAAAARACAVKDSIKAEGGAQRLAATAAHALATRAADAAALLRALTPCLDWLELEAIAGESSPLPPGLGAALGDVSGGDDLRAAAAHALAHLLQRKLPSGSAKLALLRRLAPPDALAALTPLTAPSEEEEDDSDCGNEDDAVETLVATAACEYLHAARHGAGADAEKCSDALFVRTVCGLASRHAAGELPAATGAFVAAWLARCSARAAADAADANAISWSPAQEEEQAAALVALLLRRARQLRSGAEAAEAAAEARAALFPTLRAAARAAPAAVARAMAACATAALRPTTPADVAPADVEAMLLAVHALGEGVPAAVEAAMSSLAAEIVATSPVPHATHPRVAPAALELIVRFWQALPPAALPGALAAFLDSRGVMCCDVAAAARAAYLLTRFARAARTPLAPLAVAAAAAMQPALRHVITTTTLSGGPRAAVAGGARLCAFEAAGVLLGAEEVPPDDASACAAAILRDIASAIDAAAPAAASAPPGSADAAAAGERLALALGALTAFSKGFPPSQSRTPACRSARPALAAELAAAFASATAALASQPSPPPRAAALLHRCCEALGDAALPLLPAALERLLQRSTAQSAPELLRLLSSLAQRYGTAVAPLLAPALPTLFAAAEAAASAAAPGAEAEARCEWHNFLQAHIRHAHGAGHLLQPDAAPLLAAAARDAGGAPHIATRRAALAALGALVRAVDGGGDATQLAATPAGFELAAFAAYVGQHLGVGACLLPLLRGDLDTADAAAAALLADLAAFGCGALARGAACGAAWAAAARSAMAAAGVPAAEAAEFEARFCTPPPRVGPAIADGKGLRLLAARLAAVAAPAMRAAGVAPVPAA